MFLCIQSQHTTHNTQKITLYKFHTHKRKPPRLNQTKPNKSIFQYPIPNIVQLIFQTISPNSLS
jgi:hypothetical protein